MRRALLIAGIDAIGTARLPALLSEAGFSVELLASSRLAVSNSRFVSRRLPCPSGPEATAQTAREYLSGIKNHAAVHYDYILLADEPTVIAALRQPSPEWLKPWFPVPVTEDAIRLVQSKTAFLVACRDAGLPVPQFEVCRSGPEILAASARIGLPIYVKAAQGCAGSGVYYSASQAELNSQLARIPLADGVLVQASVPGRPASAAVLFDRGRPVCWFGYLMELLWPNRLGAASSIRFLPHPDWEPLLRGVGEVTQFHGLAGIDCILSEANSLSLLEVNPRPTPNFHLGPRVGVNFADGLKQLGSGNCPQRPNGSAELVDLYPQALYYALEHRQPGRFLRSFGDAPWSDPRLTATCFRRFVTHYLPPSLRQQAKRLFRRT